MPNDTKKTHDALAADWQENARKHEDENYKFLRRVKQRVSSTKVDRIALELQRRRSASWTARSAPTAAARCVLLSPTRTSPGSPVFYLVEQMKRRLGRW
jgi:hypothetical protein